MFRTLQRIILVAAGSLFGFLGAANATPLNTLSIIDTSCAQSPQFFESSTGQVSTAFDASLGQCAFGVTARSGGGGAGVNLGLVTTPGQGGQGIGSVEVIAEALIEISIGVPEGFGGGNIPISFAPHLSGNSSATMENGSNNARGAFASLRAFASIAGIDADGTSTNTSAFQEELALASAVSFSAGGPPIVAGALLSQFLAPGTIFVDPTRTVEVRFRLTAGVSHSAFNDSTATANVSSFNSLSFALSGPALFLPDGFTANSELGLIANNVFLGAGTNTNGNQVPEPGALVLFGFGLVGLGIARRRRLVMGT